MKLHVEVKGDLKKTSKKLENASKMEIISRLNEFGNLGIVALSSATPTKTGLTANSWSFKIAATNRGYKIEWYNSNVNDGINIAIILQYGHGTGTGGWVNGRDYINPAIRPVFEKLANDAWQAVR